MRRQSNSEQTAVQICERLCKKISRGVKRNCGSRLHAHVGDVNVGAGVDVVEHVPASVVGIFIDDKIVAAIPAPVRADGPVPGSNFKGEAAGQPETVMAVLEGMIDAEALVVGAVVAVPMVIVDVRSGVDVAGRMAFGFRLGAWLWPGRRGRRNASLVGARRILLALIAALRNYRQS